MHLKRVPVKWWQSQLQYVNSRKCKPQDWLRRNCFHIGNLMLIHSDGSVQEKSYSVSYALGLRLSCTNPSIWNLKKRGAYLYLKLMSFIEIIFDTQNVLLFSHYSDVIVSSISSQIISLTIVYSSVYSGADKKTSKLRVTALCAGNSPKTGEFPAQRASYAEMFPFDDVIMYYSWHMSGHI